MPEHQELPSCPHPGGDTTYLWQGEEGPAFLQEQPWLHGGRAKSLSQPHLESQAGILVPPRSHFPTSTEAAEQALSSPAHAL